MYFVFKFFFKLKVIILTLQYSLKTHSDYFLKTKTRNFKLLNLINFGLVRQF